MATDDGPRTPGAVANEDDQARANREYQELMRLVSYGDSLHNERVRLWLMVHPILAALIAANLNTPRATRNLYALWFICAVGMLLAIAWHLTVWRVSARLTKLLDFVQTKFQDSPFAWWVRFWNPPNSARTSMAQSQGVTTAILTYVLPAAFFLAYWVLAVIGTV